MVKISSKLGLGTVQWGLEYGISNQVGQTDKEEASRILKYAKSLGIETIDTARAYGQAEHVIGTVDLSGFKVITKIPKVNNLNMSPSHLEQWLEVSFEESLSALGVNSVEGLLVHHCDDLFSRSGSVIVSFLHKLKSLGKCRKIGVSVYNSIQVRKVLELFIPDIVQLPFSVFDQRLLFDGTLSTLHKLGVETHARSVFLQGLLVMKIEDVPAFFSPWMPSLLAWHEICLDFALSPQCLALNFALSNNLIDKVIVGVESLSQLVDLSSSVMFEFDGSTLKRFGLRDPRILNPANWRLEA